MTRSKTSGRVFAVLLLFVCFGTNHGRDRGVSLRVATFRCDVTPPPGEPLIWDLPLRSVEQPLLAKGIVLDDGQSRYVLCAIDWCEVCNDSDLHLRSRLAMGAGTDVSRVVLSSVHQHAAPYADSGAHQLLDGAPNPPLRLSDRFLAEVSRRLKEAARDAVARLREVNRIGTGTAIVERVASTRRLKDDQGNVVVRFSTGGKSRELAQAPEGDIDPFLRIVTLAQDDTPLVRLHYYATHPQTFCCDGRASSDFVGYAREKLQEQEGVFQIYFTGAAGDVTVGKYNDGSPEAAAGLGERLLRAMEQAARSTTWSPLRNLSWRTVTLKLPPRTDLGYRPIDALDRANDPKATPAERVNRGAIAAAYAARVDRPLEVRCLEIGDVSLLYLPGEPMLEFQLFAEKSGQGRFVAVAGYADCGPGYVCTDAAFREGGYEPTAANSGPGSEALMKSAIRQLLESK